MLSTIERREVPPWVERQITSLGGLNQYGRPNYRVIWGGNRTHLVGGMFKKVISVETGTMIIGEAKTASVVVPTPEIRTLLKYHPHRWHLERYRGPEFYGSREDWYEQTWDEECGFHTMGDYPTEGDYEHVFYLGMCPHMKADDTEWCRLCSVSSGHYIPLEDNVHMLEMMINALRMSEDVSKKDEQISLFKREADKREENRKRVQARVEGALVSKMALNPTSWQPGMGAKTAVREASPHTRAIMFDRKRLGFSQSMDMMPDAKQKQLDQ